MQNFHCNYINGKYGDIANMIITDTDEIFTKASANIKSYLTSVISKKIR